MFGHGIGRVRQEGGIGRAIFILSILEMLSTAYMVPSGISGHYMWCHQHNPIIMIACSPQHLT
jgi:hypothetical protein